MQSMGVSATARLKEASPVAADVRLMRFEILDGDVHTSPGSHLTFEIPLGEGRTTRSYSVVDDRSGSNLISIAVKREEPGRGGSRHMWSLEPGDTMRIVESGNSMPVSFDRAGYLLIAGGIGITPMTAIAGALHTAGKSVRMIYCSRSAENAAFVDSLSDLLGGNFSLHLSDEGGRVDLAKVVEGVEPGTQVYVCGPIRLLDEIKAAWMACGLPMHDLRFETFANSGNRPSQPFDVTVAESGRTVHVEAGQTLLEALSGSGHEVMYECMKGECGLCKLEVVETDSEIDHRDVFLSEREKESGTCMCACVSRISGGSAHIRIDGIQHGRSG